MGQDLFRFSLAIFTLELTGVAVAHPELYRLDPVRAQLSRPWHHVGEPVSAQRKADDEAKCMRIAEIAPRTGVDIETEFLTSYVACLRSFGYEPAPPLD
jgi:hypothetical protein